MPLGFKKASSKKKGSGEAPFSVAKSVDQLDTDATPEMELAEAKDKIQVLERELAECKAELLELRELAGQNSNEEINSLKQQMTEVSTENNDLKKWIKELQGENSDMKKVFGNLDDLGELRQQYEALFEDDFKSSNADVDIDTSHNPAVSEERREKTNEFCNDLKAFILDVRTTSLGAQ